MLSRFLIVVFLTLLLAGCATTTSISSNQAKQLQSQVQELQNRVSFLEEELQKKDQEIVYLQGELESVPNKESSDKQKTETTTTQLSVRQIQTALKNAGFYNGPSDGKLGTQTKSAIKKFQKAHGLTADGVIGKSTASALSRYLTK